MRMAICEGVRMMPAPIELPRVTAIPKVTPRMRSKLPVVGAGFGLAAVGSILPCNSANSTAGDHAEMTAAENTKETRA